MKHVLVDTKNLFFRIEFMLMKRNPEEMEGLFWHIFFSSILKIHREHDTTKKFVFLTDKGRSWRKKENETYKSNRLLERNFLFNVHDDILDFIKNETNCSVVCEEGLEADDLFWAWKQVYGNDIIMVSADTDLLQLVDERTVFHDPMKDILVTKEGAFLFRNRKRKGPYAVKVKRYGKIEIDQNSVDGGFDTEKFIFFKILTGDQSDCVKPVVPRLSTRKIESLYASMKNNDFDWINFYNENRDRIEENRRLLVLNAMPEEIARKAVECVEKTVFPSHDPGRIFMNIMSTLDRHLLASHMSNIHEILEVFR